MDKCIVLLITQLDVEKECITQWGWAKSINLNNNAAPCGRNYDYRCVYGRFMKLFTNIIAPTPTKSTKGYSMVLHSIAKAKHMVTKASKIKLKS